MLSSVNTNYNSFFCSGIGSDSMSTMSFSGDELLGSLKDMQNAVEVNEQMKDTMYFI